MMGEREQAVLEEIRRTKPGVIGFARPEPAVSKAVSEVRAVLRKVGEAAAQDLCRTWRGAGGDELRKRASTGWMRHEEDIAAAYKAGQRAGDRLVKALRRGAAVP